MPRLGALAIGVVAASLAIAAIGHAGPAGARGATGRVTGTVSVRRDGAPVDASGVVVYLVGFAEAPPRQTARIRQRGRTFIPDLLPITAGQAVTFPNQDPFVHNVFSPSPVRRFDLGQYPSGTTKSKRFPSVGVVDVFCNIHPEMAATVLVLPNRRFARAGRDGRFRIDGVPPGRWTVYAFSRRAMAPVSAPVQVAAGAATELALAIEETRTDFAHPNKYGENYKESTSYQ
jgi:plastocyanin